MFDVAEGYFDKCRGTVQGGDEANALSIQQGLDFGKRGLQRFGDKQGIRARLTGHSEEHAPLAVDQRIADFWFGSVGDGCDVAQADGNIVRVGVENYLAES